MLTVNIPFDFELNIKNQTRLCILNLVISIDQKNLARTFF